MIYASFRKSIFVFLCHIGFKNLIYYKFDFTIAGKVTTLCYQKDCFDIDSRCVPLTHSTKRWQSFELGGETLSDLFDGRQQ